MRFKNNIVNWQVRAATCPNQVVKISTNSLVRLIAERTITPVIIVKHQTTLTSCGIQLVLLSELLLWETIRMQIDFKTRRVMFCINWQLWEATPSTKQRMLQGSVIYVTVSYLGPSWSETCQNKNLLKYQT